MTHAPQIPQSDNPYELAMHAGNVRYYEQNSFNPKVEALEATATAIAAEAVAVIGVIIAAVFVWAALPGDYDQPSKPLLPSVLVQQSK